MTAPPSNAWQQTWLSPVLNLFVAAIFSPEYKSIFTYYLDPISVAFDVRLAKDVSDLAKNGRVVFGTVDLNEGNGYDPSTGIFTAPSAGLYVFDWTTMTHQGRDVYTSLIVNGSFKSWNHCRDSSSKTYLSCSKMTIVKLKQGDKVWIGVFAGSATMYHQYTSFSGFKHWTKTFDKECDYNDSY